jgi:hypothetical protein
LKENSIIYRHYKSISITLFKMQRQADNNEWIDTRAQVSRRRRRIPVRCCSFCREDDHFISNCNSPRFSHFEMILLQKKVHYLHRENLAQTYDFCLNRKSAVKIDICMVGVDFQCHYSGEHLPFLRFLMEVGPSTIDFPKCVRQHSDPKP